jgi:hypothetical protein
MATIAYTQEIRQMTSEEKEEERSTYKEEIRKRYRRPLNELVNELGEGRGMYAVFLCGSSLTMSRHLPSRI